MKNLILFLICVGGITLSAKPCSTFNGHWKGLGTGSITWSQDPICDIKLDFVCDDQKLELNGYYNCYRASGSGWGLMIKGKLRVEDGKLYNKDLYAGSIHSGKIEYTLPGGASCSHYVKIHLGEEGLLFHTRNRCPEVFLFEERSAAGMLVRKERHQ